jgi:hypothetical protein
VGHLPTDPTDQKMTDGEVAYQPKQKGNKEE